MILDNAPLKVVIKTTKENSSFSVVHASSVKDIKMKLERPADHHFFHRLFTLHFKIVIFLKTILETEKWMLWVITWQQQQASYTTWFCLYCLQNTEVIVK